MVKRSNLNMNDKLSMNEGDCYESPMIEIIEMEAVNIIAASADGFDNGGGYGN